jgi:hypothetical protein
MNKFGVPKYIVNTQPPGGLPPSFVLSLSLSSVLQLVFEVVLTLVKIYKMPTML